MMNVNSNSLVKKVDNSPVARLKAAISSESVQQQFRNALKENAGLFIASLIDVYASDTYLQTCSPKDVIMEALKAATLKLPINKNLGFAYIVPYKNKATMIIGYKGYLQLAQRTAQYKYINADAVYEGEKVDIDRLTGEVYFSGDAISEVAIGYFAHIETLNGFRKTVFWTKEKVENHAKKYSQSFSSNAGPWRQHFDAMAIKTVIKHLLTKFGIMSVDMAQAIDIDNGDYQEAKVIPRQKIGSASYDATESAPESLENDSAYANNGAQVDEFGTLMDSPWEKSKWFNLKSSGFILYLQQYRGELKDKSKALIEAVKAKHLKLYGQHVDLDDVLNQSEGATAQAQDEHSKGDPENQESEGQAQEDPGDPGQEEQGQEDQDQEVDLLQSEAAQALAKLAQAHPLIYQQVVQNRVPESIEQIFDWTSQINEAIVASKSAQ